MSKIFPSADGIIGNTPLLRLSRIEQKFGLKARILAKLEMLNPTGSIKDRVAKAMIDCAEREGKLLPGGVIIEPTSGNTGIGLAAVGAARGYRVIIVMPDNMSKERVMLMQAYGAEVIKSDGALGMAGAIEKAESLHGAIPDSIIAGQFTNPVNPQSHYDSTAPEIYRDTDGKVDIFVAGVGTGGTISGCGKYLKKRNPAVEIIAVEPLSSPVLSGGKAGVHGIQGIGAGFIPKTLDTSIIDSVVAVSDDKACEFCKMLGREEGVFAGISSGAALFAAVEEAKKACNADKNIVVILPDSGDRYLSAAVSQED